MSKIEKPAPHQRSRPYLVARKLALGTYSLVLPVLQPVVRRARRFFTHPLIEEVAQLREAVAALQRTVGDASVATAEIVRTSTERVLTAQLRTDRTAREALSRLTAYAGENITLCYLPGRAPILVNSDDDGVPARLIAGIPWEPENVEMLLSFLRPDSVILDIGANVGFFSVSLGRRLGARGRVHAFEPHPQLAKLLRRNALLNSLEARVSVHQLAASDSAGEVSLFYPLGHLGSGGCIHAEPNQPGLKVVARCERLDDVFPPDFRVDIVKLDVEGHEVSVLRGMAGIIARSPQAVYLIEKLEEFGDGSEIFHILTAAGLRLCGVGAHAQLLPLDAATYKPWSGYVVAGRDEVLRTYRGPSFGIYPAQLHGRLHADAGPTSLRSRPGEVLFFGPYWPLPAGRWKVRVVGEIKGALTLRLSDQGGDAFAEFDFSDLRDEAIVEVPEGIERFEAIGLAGGLLDLTLERLDFVRINRTLE